MSCKKILEAFQIDLVWAAVFFKEDAVPRTHPALKTDLKA